MVRLAPRQGIHRRTWPSLPLAVAGFGAASAAQPRSLAIHGDRIGTGRGAGATARSGQPTRYGLKERCRSAWCDASAKGARVQRRCDVRGLRTTSAPDEELSATAKPPGIAVPRQLGERSPSCQDSGAAEGQPNGRSTPNRRSFGFRLGCISRRIGKSCPATAAPSECRGARAHSWTSCWGRPAIGTCPRRDGSGQALLVNP